MFVVLIGLIAAILCYYCIYKWNKEDRMIVLSIILGIIVIIGIIGSICALVDAEPIVLLLAFLIIFLDLFIFSLINIIIHAVYAGKPEKAKNHRRCLLICCIPYCYLFMLASIMLCAGLESHGTPGTTNIILPVIVIAIVEVIYLVYRSKKSKKEYLAPLVQEPNPVEIEISQAETLVTEQLAKMEVSERTAFQDSLKGTLKTKDEVSEKELTICRNMALRKVNETLNKIRDSLLAKAENAESFEENGKRYVSTIVNLPYEYMARIKNALGREVTFSIDESHAKEYEIFISELQTSAAYDGIKVIPMIYNDKKDEWHKIPYVWKDKDTFGSIREESCSLVVKCVCEIPEKYSSDVPLSFNAENEDNETVSVETTNEKDIDRMDGYEFESFCADLLRKNGYKDVSVTSGSGDQGIDIIAHKDGVKYGIQCKCYTSDVGNKAVQEAYSGKSFYQCHVGIVLTNRYFTNSAKDLAQNNGIVL